MFSDEILEKIFIRQDVRKVPLTYQSIMVHAVEEVALRREQDCRAATLICLRPVPSAAHWERATHFTCVNNVSEI